MRHLLVTGLLLLGSIPPAMAASSEDGPKATLSWRLGFGAGRTLHTGYALALDYRPGQADAPAARLLELDVADGAALARLAGLDLFGRRYQANQDGDEPLPAAGSTDTPWYARQWVWWTVGGMAATAALAGGAEVATTYHSNGSSGSNGECTIASDGTVVGNCSGTVVGQNDEGEPCAMEGFGDDVPEACAPTGGYAGRESRGPSAWRPEPSWLDAGTGGMGDLVAR